MCDVATSWHFTCQILRGKKKKINVVLSQLWGEKDPLKQTNKTKKALMFHQCFSAEELTSTAFFFKQRKVMMPFLSLVSEEEVSVPQSPQITSEAVG